MTKSRLAPRREDDSSEVRELREQVGGRRHELARAIFAAAGADPDRVLAATSGEVVRPAPRPAYSVLSNESWKAAGLTALAPAVLLGAAVLLAAGAGFGGLSSLGQVAGGPQIPSVEQPDATASSAGRSAAPAQSPVSALATPAPGGAATAPARGGGDGGTQVRSTAPVAEPQRPAQTTPGTRTPTRRPTPTSPSSPRPGSTPTTPDQAAPVTPTPPTVPQAPGLPNAPNPVQPLLDIPKALPAPVGPLTGRLLDGVTGTFPR